MLPKRDTTICRRSSSCLPPNNIAISSWAGLALRRTDAATSLQYLQALLNLGRLPLWRNRFNQPQPMAERSHSSRLDC